MHQSIYNENGRLIQTDEMDGIADAVVSSVGKIRAKDYLGVMRGLAIKHEKDDPIWAMYFSSHADAVEKMLTVGPHPR